MTHYYLMLVLLLVGLVAGGFPSQQIISTGRWFRNTTATGPPEVLVCNGVTGSMSLGAFWFSSVSVPQGAVIQNATLTLYLLQNLMLNLLIENVDNSSPLMDCMEAPSRNRASTGASSGPGRKEFIVTSLVTQVVARAGWNYGNAMLLGALTSVTSNTFGTEATLRINYTVASSVNLSYATSIVPLAGNWSTGLTVGATNKNLSVAVPNVVFRPSFGMVPLNVSITGTLVAALGMGSMDCLNPPTVLTTPFVMSQYVCQVPCAPGAGYQLNLNYCWGVTETQVLGNLVMTHQLTPANTGCWNEVLSGYINFPPPVLLSGTLMPDDGRPWSIGGGQITSNATVQPLNSRDMFRAVVGLQHFCPGTWVTLTMQSISVPSMAWELPCTPEVGRVIAPPPNAADDFYTLQFTVPPCSQAACPGEVSMSLRIVYGNYIFRTDDSLVQQILLPLLPFPLPSLFLPSF